MCQVYNIMEFAELMGVSIKTLRRLDRSGDLVADRVLNNQYQYNDSHKTLLENARREYLKKRTKKRSAYPSNLIGQRFGKLVVIDVAEDNISPKGKRRKQWLCQCDCGDKCLAMDNSLRAGYKKSCGCLFRGDNETKQMWKDFNALKESDAIGILQNLNRPYIKTSHIPKKRKGGHKKDNLLGKKFGLWTVIDKAETRHYKNGGSATCWLCKCECGNVKSVPSRDLKSGASQSCGCASSTSWLEYYTKKYLKEHNLMFESQKSYNDLLGINGVRLSYDFLVFKNNEPFCLIECQGKQHFRPIKKFGGAKQLLKQMKHDDLKKAYAKNVLKIPLYEILYTLMTKSEVYDALDKLNIVN